MVATGMMHTPYKPLAGHPDSSTWNRTLNCRRTGNGCFEIRTADRGKTRRTSNKYWISPTVCFCRSIAGICKTLLLILFNNNHCSSVLCSQCCRIAVFILLSSQVSCRFISWINPPKSSSPLFHLSSFSSSLPFSSLFSVLFYFSYSLSLPFFFFFFLSLSSLLLPLIDRTVNILIPLTDLPLYSP